MHSDSFDLHFHFDRTGAMRVSTTRDDGTKTRPVVVSDGEREALLRAFSSIYDRMTDAERE